MGKSHIICSVFIVAVQFSAGLGRNHSYEYYISKYHHKSSTALSSSIAGISPDVTTESSVSADIEHTPHRNRTGHSNEYGFADDRSHFPDWALNTIAVIAPLILISCCCLCYCFYHRKKVNRSGFVIEDRVPIPAPTVHADQSTTSQRPLMGLQYPPQYHSQEPQSFPAPPQYQDEQSQLFPPQYQTPAMQQSYQSVHNHYQSQRSPTAPMDHNPPEAPPPYDFPEKF